MRRLFSCTLSARSRERLRAHSPPTPFPSDFSCLFIAGDETRDAESKAYPWVVLSTPTGNIATQLIKRELKSPKGAVVEIRSLAVSLNENESELVGLSVHNQKASGKHTAQLLRVVHMTAGGHGDKWWHSGDASYVAGRKWSIALPNVTLVEYPTKAAAEAAAAGEAASGDDNESGEIKFDDDGGSGEMEHDGPLDDEPEEELEEELEEDEA